MDTGIDAAGNSEDASASFGDTEGTDQFTGVAIKGTLLNFNEISIKCYKSFFFFSLVQWAQCRNEGHEPA